jgi:hypothetical protein
MPIAAHRTHRQPRPRRSWSTTIVLASCIVALGGCATGSTTTTTTTSTSLTPTHTEAAAKTRTATNARRAAPTPAVIPAAGCPDGDYVTRTFCYLRRAGVRNSMIDADCGPLLSSDHRDPGHACRNDIERYETFLADAQRDLRLQDPGGAPANLREPASWLRRAVSDDLKAARLAIRAIQSHDYLGFLNAWSVHGKAGRELQTAGDTYLNR